MTSQPISLLRGQNHVATIRVELGGAPLDLSTASAATFIAKPSEYSPAVKITKTIGSGVAAGATGSALITITTSDAAALDISESYSWTLTATIDGTAAVVARGVLTAIGTPQQFVDDGVDRVARDAAAAALALAPQSAATAAAAAVAAHNADGGAHGLDKFCQSIPWFNIDAAYTGGGCALGGSPMQLGLSTGASGGSATRRTALDYHPIALIGQTGVRLAAIPFRLSVVGVRCFASAGGSCWFSFGLAYDEADTAQDSVGFYVVDGQVLIRHRNGGGLVDTPTSLVVPTESACRFDILKGPTSLEVRVNGVSGGLVETGAITLQSYRGAGAKVVAVAGEEGWRFGIPTICNV